MTETEIRAGKTRCFVASGVLIAGGTTLMSGILPSDTGRMLVLAGSVVVVIILVWWKNSLPWGS